MLIAVNGRRIGRSVMAKRQKITNGAAVAGVAGVVAGRLLWRCRLVALAMATATMARRARIMVEPRKHMQRLPEGHHRRPLERRERVCYLAQA